MTKLISWKLCKWGCLFTFCINRKLQIETKDFAFLGADNEGASIIMKTRLDGDWLFNFVHASDSFQTIPSANNFRALYAEDLYNWMSTRTFVIYGNCQHAVILIEFNFGECGDDWRASGCFYNLIIKIGPYRLVKTYSKWCSISK